PGGEKLGHLEGFIIDGSLGRPYYGVVNAGGWFKSKHFLLPIGYTRLDDTQKALIADLDKERIKQFPGFDLDKFEKLSDEDLKRIADETAAACSPTEILVVEELVWTDRPHYQAPSWWDSDFYRPDRASANDITGMSSGAKREAS